MLGINFLNSDPLNVAIITAFLINLLEHLFLGLNLPYSYSSTFKCPPSSAAARISRAQVNVANAFLDLRRS